jgi:transcription antitermination factor NusG
MPPAMRGGDACALPADATLPWWALYTRHQHERVIADHLIAKGLDVFLPMYESVRSWKDRKKVLSLPLFPGYVLVRGSDERKLQIVSTPGVHMILTFGDRIAAIPEAEIDAIRRTVEGDRPVEPYPFLCCGERVRVRRGAMQGLEGILERWKGAARLILSVQMLARSVAVEIDAFEVEAVSRPSAPASLCMQQAVPAPLF